MLLTSPSSLPGRAEPTWQAEPEKDPLLYHPHRPRERWGRRSPRCSDPEMLAGV